MYAMCMQGEDEPIPVSCLSDKPVEEAEIHDWQTFICKAPELQPPGLIQVSSWPKRCMKAESKRLQRYPKGGQQMHPILGKLGLQAWCQRQF